ncbi:MAG: AAA family ATPase, partial [Armatimonadota bacterium]|nr:AAA family ATPase [Armatimonadota bacterium]
MPIQHTITDNLEQLLEVLPPRFQQQLAHHDHLDEMLEIVMDLGREAEVRFPGNAIYLDGTVTQEDIDYVTKRVGAFGKDNRAGIERTLHRISAIRNRAGRVIGLTCRIGRAVYGTVDIIRDVVEGGHSILLLGRPGVGKTTKLREVARVLADDLNKRVVIVDTSNEIAGDGDIPHPAIGHARRMQVVTPDMQHAVMIEAVENHMPECIVIDEIGTEQEAFAARTIAERGVQLVATAHGNTLDNLLMNPTLSDLVGGVQAVTLSDEEARRRRTQKTVLERKAPPTFDVLIEILEMDKLAIHHDVATTVDRMLRGIPPSPEIRVRTPSGEVEVLSAPEPEGREEEREDEERTTSWGPPVGRTSFSFADQQTPGKPPKLVRIFPYGVSRSRLEKGIRELRVPAAITRDWRDADVLLTLKAHYRREPGKLKEVVGAEVPVHIIKSNTYVQIASALRDMFQIHDRNSEEDEAIREAEDAVERVMALDEPVELAPQP